MSKAMVKSAVSAPSCIASDTYLAPRDKDPIFGGSDELDDTILNPKCPLPSNPGPYSVGERLFFKKTVDGEREPLFFTVAKIFEGGLGEGCTQSCCLLVEIHQVDNALPQIHRDRRCVLKVFDFKHSQGLREEYNCGVFTPECAAALNQLTANDECLNPVYWLEQNLDVEKSQSTLLADELGDEAIGSSVSRLELARFELDDVYKDARSKDPNFPLLSLGLTEKEAFLFTLMQQDYAHQRKCFDAIDGLEGFPSFIASGFIVRECEEATPAPQLCHYPAIMMSFIEHAVTLQTLSSAKKNGCPKNHHSDVETVIIQEALSFSDEQWHTIHCQTHAVIYRLWLQGLQYDDLRSANFMMARDGPGQFRIVLIDMGGVKVLDQEYIELYSMDRGRRRYLESRPEPQVWQYGDNTIHQQRVNEDLENSLQSMMQSIVPSSYINSPHFSFYGVSTMRFRDFFGSHQEDCETTAWRFLFETLFASLARSRFGDEPATVAAILRHARCILDFEYCRSSLFAFWGYRAFLRIALLVRPLDHHPEHSNELLYRKSTLLQHALEKRPGSANFPFEIKQIQEWAQASELWYDAPWSDPSVQSTRVLSLLDQRQKQIQNEDQIVRTFVISDQLLNAGKDILWTENDIARSRQPPTNGFILQS